MQIKRAKEQSIKVKTQSIRQASATGAMIVSDQMDGGDEVQNAAITAYVMSRPIAGVSNQGAKLARNSAKVAHDRRIKRKEQRIAKQNQDSENKSKDSNRDKKKPDIDHQGGHGEEQRTSDHKERFTGRKKSSDKNDSDKGNDKKRRKGIRGMIRKLQMVTFVKQSKQEEGEGKNSRWQMLLVQKIVIPVLGYLALGMMIVALVALPVMLVIALIYNSPFAIFFPPLESGDTVQSVTSAYVSEFHREVNELATNHEGYDIGRVVYVDYEGTNVSPSNYYDILSVYMIKHGVGDSATIINDTTKEWIETVVDDMCDYTTSTGSETIQDEAGNTVSQSVLYVNVTLRDYSDMISIYRFDTNQVELLETLMSPESLAMLGYSGDSEIGQSSISTPEKEKILSGITDERQRKVCSFALSKVGYPYSQAYRDSGDYFDCSSLAFYAWKYADVNISYGGATTAAAEAQGLDEAGKTVAYEELQPGDLIFFSYCHNGRYRNISHVAIYMGSGKVVEAKNESAGVVYGDIPNPECIVTIGRP